MRRLRAGGVGVIGLGIALLILGFVISNDVLGFLFMVCVVVGAALVVSDLVLQRRGRPGT